MHKFWTNVPNICYKIKSTQELKNIKHAVRFKKHRIITKFVSLCHHLFKCNLNWLKCFARHALKNKKISWNAGKITVVKTSKSTSQPNWILQWILLYSWSYFKINLLKINSIFRHNFRQVFLLGIHALRKHFIFSRCFNYGTTTLRLSW
jgi:hypothetical protein